MSRILRVAELPDARRVGWVDRNAAPVLIIVTVARAIIPGAVNFTLVPHQSLPVYDSVTRAPAASVVGLLLTGVMVIVALATCLRGEAMQRYYLRELGVLSVACLLLFSNVLRGGADLQDVANEVSSVLVIAAVIRARRSPLTPLIIRLVIVSVVLFALLSGFLVPALATYPDSSGEIAAASDKSLIGDSQLAGPFAHSNTLGLFVALGLPFVAQFRSVVIRLVAVLASMYCLVWSASRTALIALLAAMVVWCAVRVAPRAIRGVAFMLGLLGALGLTAVLPLLTSDPTAFTDRGAIWIGSLHAVQSSPIFGLGQNWYSEAAQYRNNLGLQASSGHNLLVTAMVWGGLVLTVAMYATTVQAGRFESLSNMSATWAVRLFLLIFAVASLTEFIWLVAADSELFLVSGFMFALITCGHMSSAQVPNTFTASTPS